MKILHPPKVDITTYHFRVKKNVGVSSSRVMFMVHDSRRNSIGPFHYCIP